jgi:hypothetical protein
MGTEGWEPVPNEQPWWPGWLVDRVGLDYFGNVVCVGLSEAGSDAELSHVGRLNRLQELHVSSHVTDAGLKNLTGLTRLREMTLSYGNSRGLEPTGISDVGLAHLIGLALLRGLTGLERLTLLMTNVSRERVSELNKALPKLHITW